MQGRAACPQAAVHPALNILYNEGGHAGKAEANGALGQSALPEQSIDQA